MGLKSEVYKRIVVLFLFVFVVQYSNAQKFNEWFVDSTDNALDISGFLKSRAGFMPVPILITEPAVGYGGGLAAAYFHDKESGVASPTMSMVAGAYTENGTYLTLLGHKGSYKKDRFRYLGAVGYLSVNLDLYKKGVLTGKTNKYRFNMTGFLLFQEFLVRVNKDKPFFLGVNYTYFNNNVTFNTGINFPGLEKLEVVSNIGGLKAVTLWDTRDNQFTPKKGIMTSTEFGHFSKALGGDSDYWNLSHRTYFYKPIIKKKLFSGYRIQIDSKTSEAPFYQLPFINLRGIQVMRYQDYNVLTAETEWRWNVVNRWSLVGFAGFGNAMEDYSEFSFDLSKVAGGGGFRYLIAKDYGIHGGIDIAKGPEIWAWYLTVGSNWLR